MPTENPRVNVTLSPADYALLSRLAKLQGRSRSDLLRDLWDTSRPVLERVAVVLEAAARAQASAKEGLRDATLKAEAEILPHVEAALGQLDIFVSAAVRPTVPAGGASGAPKAPGAAPNPRASNHGGQVPPKRTRSTPSRSPVQASRPRRAKGGRR